MIKRYREVRKFLADKKAMAEEAAARGEWKRVVPALQSRQQRIDEAIEDYDACRDKAADLRDWLRKHGVPPQSPPDGARDHPSTLLPRRGG
jgi:TorA maturation chaperone TorD